MRSAIVMVLLAAMLPAAAEPQPAKKVGWIEPVVQNIEGWTVEVDPALLETDKGTPGPSPLTMLANHLQRISILVPPKQLAEMRKLGIRIEKSHPELKPMQYHPDADWLVERGYDPRLAKKVHIPQAGELVSRSQMLKHPAVILHELAHAYHDQVLGFEDAGILKAYQAAMKAGIYEKALLFNGETVRHYGATDHKEYFSESTESYLYHNDFYPFVRAELRLHDPGMFAEMERVWGKIGDRE